MPKIAIFAGHGGQDFGAIVGDKSEKELNLAIALEVTRILKSGGYEVLNNRTTDSDRNIYSNAVMANSENVDVIVEIHMNHSETPDENGVETIHSIFNDGKGKELATNIATNIAALGFPNRGTHTRKAHAKNVDYWGIIRLTKAPAVIVKTAFISSESDMANFGIQPIAQAIADAIMQTFPIQQPKEPAEPAVTVTISQPQIQVPPPHHPPTQSVRIGSRNEIVTAIQKALNSKGYSLAITGIFESITEIKLKSFQNDNNLPASGIADVATQALLLS